MVEEDSQSNLKPCWEICKWLAERVHKVLIPLPLYSDVQTSPQNKLEWLSRCWMQPHCLAMKIFVHSSPTAWKLKYKLQPLTFFLRIWVHHLLLCSGNQFHIQVYSFLQKQMWMLRERGRGMDTLWTSYSLRTANYGYSSYIYTYMNALCPKCKADFIIHTDHSYALLHWSYCRSRINVWL